MGLFNFFKKEKLKVDSSLKEKFKNFLLVLDDLEVNFQFQKEDPSGLHYVADQGYQYNEYAKKELHEGYLYSSIYIRPDIKPEGYLFRVYSVTKYERADIVYLGDALAIQPNQSIEYYKELFKKSFTKFVYNRENEIRQVHPK